MTNKLKVILILLTTSTIKRKRWKLGIATGTIWIDTFLNVLSDVDNKGPKGN